MPGLGEAMVPDATSTYIFIIRTPKLAEMKKYLLLNLLCILSMMATAQNSQGLPFKGVIGNSAYGIYIKMNLYDNNVTVPGQEIFGELPGFMGDSIDSRKWLFTSAKINKNTARLEITNDYGSEDLVATLTLNKDNTYTLQQVEGSNMRIARQKKWKKLPKTLIFVRER